MTIQHSIVNKLFESKHLPDGLSMEDVRLSETVVVNGSWYWKSKGTCWTQPTDKSSPRKEISEEEYRKVCSQSKNGVSELPIKKDELKKSEVPPARGDYFGAANLYRVGRSGNFEKDMQFIKDRKPGVTAELVYGDKTREYVRKVGDNKWKTDTGKTLSDNDIASVAYDDGKTTINYMVKNQPSEDADDEEIRRKKSMERKQAFSNYTGTTI